MQEHLYWPNGEQCKRIQVFKQQIRDPRTQKIPLSQHINWCLG